MRSAKRSDEQLPAEHPAPGRGRAPHLEVLLERCGRLRDQVLGRIADANTASERGVLAAVTALRRIVGSTNDHLGVIDTLRAGAAQGGRSELGQLIQREAQGVAAFVTEMGRLTGEQDELAAAALVQVAAIREAERTITQMVTASRLLALNAQIESVRAGTSGAAFRTVAEQMEALSHQIAEANRLVGRLAGEMHRTLPNVAALAQRMKQRSSAFSSDHSALLADVEGGVAELRHAVAHTLESGHATADRVLELSRSALGELQFQDRVAQSLLAVDGDCWEIETAVAEALGEDQESIRAPVLGSTDGSSEALDEEGGSITLF